MDLIQYEMRSPVGPLYLVAGAEGLQGVYFRKQAGKSAGDLDS